MNSPRRHHTLLDACAVVNLYATRRMLKILSCVDGSVALVDVVARETQYVVRGGTGDNAREREPIEFQPALTQGVLTILSADNEGELLTYIDLTMEVDDGEAMTAALAIHRGYSVVTDDRKATRLLTSRGVVVHTSLDLIKTWSERQGATRDVLRSALVGVRQRGRYEPAQNHPLRAWWEDAIRPG